MVGPSVLLVDRTWSDRAFFLSFISFFACALSALLQLLMDPIVVGPCEGCGIEGGCWISVSSFMIAMPHLHYLYSFVALLHSPHYSDHLCILFCFDLTCVA